MKSEYCYKPNEMRLFIPVPSLIRPPGGAARVLLRSWQRAAVPEQLPVSRREFTVHDEVVLLCLFFELVLPARFASDVMAFLTLFMRRQLPPAVAHFARAAKLLRPPAAGTGAPLRRLHGSARLRTGEKAPWGQSRGPEQPQHRLTDLDKADAMMLRKSHETGFLSWFRNGLLATGVGVIAFVQSEVGREAAYAFFILGGVCVSFGGASYIGSLFALRRMMLLSVPAFLLQSAVVGGVALFWLCAVSLYIGRLEVEIIHEDEEEEEDGDECRECRERREHRGYRGSHGSRHHDTEDSDSKGSNK